MASGLASSDPLTSPPSSTVVPSSVLVNGGIVPGDNWGEQVVGRITCWVIWLGFSHATYGLVWAGRGVCVCLSRSLLVSVCVCAAWVYTMQEHVWWLGRVAMQVATGVTDPR